MAANSKNFLSPYKVVAAQQMVNSVTSSVTDVRFLDNLEYQYAWTGSPTGTIQVQSSLDYLIQNGVVINAGTWINLSLSGVTNPAGSAGNTQNYLIDFPGPYIRTTFTSTATAAQTIQPVADVAGSLAGKYFLIADTAGNKWAIWFKVSGSGSAPSVAGYTNVEQDINTNDTAATIGGDLATTIAALNGSGSFTTAGTTTVTVTDQASGPVAPMVDGNTGFTFAVTTGGGLLTVYITGKAK